MGERFQAGPEGEDWPEVDSLVAEGCIMKPYDYVAIRGLVKEHVVASKLFHSHKSAFKTAGPKGKGNLRQFARASKKQAYKAAYDEIRDKAEYEQARAKYDEVYDRIERR
jgi:hypothetical protein